jgi:hypothetical protein
MVINLNLTGITFGVNHTSKAAAAAGVRSLE